jgi:hypothetical protein
VFHSPLQKELVCIIPPSFTVTLCSDCPVYMLACVHEFLLGFDHGVGHPLLLLYDAKAPNCQKCKEFKGLGHYPSNTVYSSFCTMVKLQHLYNYLIFLPFLARY